MLKRIVYTLGQHPAKSWRWFKYGLSIFVLGVILIFAGARWWMWLQIPAVLALLIGILIAARGYIGIIANRFSMVLKRTTPPSSLDK